ncbi:23S rRNA (pseudouridine1915-N3)-methyltransferase [Herbinix hemicellulosilytica]|uniref:Ribosomal RNA large subunit methyltransferase H n=1 Tax=Herbinix hemicellulosilytica TaxID=1564487 RepID=A0A0H5SHZ7_HERHM|nr:23S rRNA (pseudouridine(1915)-N(3))-methyltransferase RlmH [Herbinix hemicellulosilytica]RBP59582.1 23S rRNA (pseudouridine1915-N3)-methyltransferase [Herbinix hemicellulosilytica]CRZ34705.1 Ribosomal RNA large subunit methyltransferase H [Herbinix hemicellulosilytica]
MKLSLICVGKIKEKYLNMGIDEYKKRLGRYCSLEIIELADEKTPDNAPAAVEEAIKRTEGARILKAIKEDSYCIVLDIKGNMLSSEELAGYMEKLFIRGKSHISFVIGGSLGLSDEVLERADFRLSFSKMTFPHQLMRMILLEQIYRAFRIMNNEPYHK